MIDLTKPIEVDILTSVNEVEVFGAYRIRALDPGQPRHKTVHLGPGKYGVDSEAEAYRLLFQESPRTKREHAKMLALLSSIRDYINEGWDRTNAVSVTDIDALVAEIEGEK
jgi:hypothetical protein